MKRIGIALVLALGLTTACGRPFQPKTPAGFVELDSKYVDYDYRATTADGLVVGIRVVKHKPRGEIAFWERAVENHLRMRGGYALLDKRDVTNANGMKGRQLRFGHDEAGKPHLYYVTLFPAKRKIFILEAGGPRDEVEKNAKLIEETVTHFRVKRCWKHGCLKAPDSGSSAPVSNAPEEAAPTDATIAEPTEPSPPSDAPPATDPSPPVETPPGAAEEPPAKKAPAE